jgi:seryl-tRNA synthetase
MLDIRRIRHEPDAVKVALARRGQGTASLDEVVELDRTQRELAEQRDQLRNEIGSLSKQVGALRRDGKAGEAEALQARSRALGDDEKALAARTDELTTRIRDLLLRIPNLPAPECPDGAGEQDNVVLRTHGRATADHAEHQRVPHWEIGEQLGILDVERGAKMSGSMFVMYRGAGAALVRALVQLALDRNADAYEEIRPPTLVRTETMVATGHLPKFADDAYHIERDDLYAIPTAEVPLTSLARDEILDEARLPMRLMAHTSCFRREAGSAGRDTRGLLRVHEFDKVEILAYSTPDDGPKLQIDILDRAESVIRDLGLTYRIVDICTGDLGSSAARTWDIEVYAPGCDKWLEVSSCSWFGDYQARRANVRYRPAGQKSTAFVHTCNGSALAVPRVWAALVETYRQADGSIALPAILGPYLRAGTTIPAR